MAEEANPLDIEETAAAPETTAGQVGTPEPATLRTYDHSQFLIRRATEVGFSEAEIKETPPAHLEGQVYRLERRVLEEARQNSAQRTIQQPQPKDPEPVEEEPDYSAYDEPIQKGLKAGGATAKKVKELEAKLARLEAIEQQREVLSHVERADAFFAKNEGRYGSGTRDDLDPKGKHFARRETVWQRAVADTGNDSFARKLARADQFIFDDTPPEAPAATYGEAPTAPTAGKPSADEARKEAWRNGGVAKPTARREAAPQKGRAAAEKAVANRIAELRAAGDNTGDADSEDFPE